MKLLSRFLRRTEICKIKDKVEKMQLAQAYLQCLSREMRMATVEYNVML